MTRLGVTGRQRDCFDAIERYIAVNKCSPSYRALARSLGISSIAGVTRLVEGLKERGWIEYSPRMKRSIRVIPCLEQSFGFVLSTTAADALHRYCVTHRERDPQAALNDIVILFVDESEGAVAA